MNLKLQDRQVFAVLSIVRDDSEMIEEGRLKACLLAETGFSGVCKSPLKKVVYPFFCYWLQ